MKRNICILLAACTVFPSFAQEQWDLRKCIDYAVEHNLSIKQKEAAQDKSAVDLNTAQWSRLPNLNGSAGQSFNFGRALQSDNTYGNRNTQNTSFSLGTSVPLFTGMEIPNNIALSKLNLKAAVEDLDKAKEDISIEVTSAYVKVLFSEELAKVAHNQVEMSRELLKQKQAFFDNGKASEAELYEARSRVAQDELSTVQADNDYQLKLLDLSQLLELPSPKGFAIVSPKVELQFAGLAMPEDIYNEAVMNKPAIRAAQYRLEGAGRSIRIAQSDWYPTLSFNAGLSTNYYKLAGAENISFGDQLDQNFSKYFSFSLSVPIFNRFATRNKVKSARINQSALAWKLEEDKKSLFKEIQLAYYNAVAAESSYTSSTVANDAAEASFRLMNEKYENGKATATEYNQSRTNWMKATSDKIQAKYDYLFKTKILDFYKGIPLALE